MSEWKATYKGTCAVITDRETSGAIATVHGLSHQTIFKRAAMIENAPEMYKELADLATLARKELPEHLRSKIKSAEALLSRISRAGHV